MDRNENHSPLRRICTTLHQNYEIPDPHLNYFLINIYGEQMDFPFCQKNQNNTRADTHLAYPDLVNKFSGTHRCQAAESFKQLKQKLILSQKMPQQLMQILLTTLLEKHYFPPYSQAQPRVVGR